MKSRTAESWKCPTCGRRFARPNQAHSCQVVDVSVHLDKAGSEVRRVYAAVLKELRACGPLDTAPTKTGINLLSRTSLGSIRLQQAKARLSLVLTRHVDDPRVHSVLKLSARSFVHYIDVATVADLDDTVRAWLREAHAVGMLAGRRVP